jgi:tetratricopeptide (TPR) repeat protein
LQTAAVAVVIAGAALAAYHNTFRVPFLFDDARAIPENPGIRQLWPLWRAFWPQSATLTVSGRPVANFTLAINYALSGTNVWSYHALNLLIHVLSGLTLFGIVRRTLLMRAMGERLGAMGDAVGRSLATDGRAPLDKLGALSLSNGQAGFLHDDAPWLALAVALLWTLHPLQTEAVTYVIQRVESLMGLFYLLTLYSFIRAVESPRPVRWQVVTVAFCLLGMGTKEVMATAPLLVLLYDRTFVAGTFHEAWRRRRWLHLCLAATWLPLAGLVASTGWNRGATTGFNAGVAPWAYWPTQFEAVARYLWLSVWPHPLVFEYGTFWVHHAGEVVPYVLVVVPLAAAAGWALWRRPLLGFLSAWFFTILALTCIVPSKIQMIVEHRMYLSLAAVVTLVVLGIHAAIGRRSWVVFAAMALGLGMLTARRNEDYRSELAIWSDTVAKRPDNTRARSGMAIALDHAGRMAEAVQQYEAALPLAPDDFDVHDNLGVTLEHNGRVTEAIEQYKAALLLKPDSPEVRSNLGNALLRLGRIPEAIRQYQMALFLKPDYAEAHYNLGGALDQAGRTDEAIQHFEAAVHLKPEYADAHNNLGNLLHRVGRTPEAIQQYEAALRIQPDLARAHHNLGVAFEETGRRPEAIQEYEAAVRIQPDLVEARNNLGVALCRSDRLPEAIAHFKEALRLRPAYVEAHDNLGNALLQAGRMDEASVEYEEVLRLRPDDAVARRNLELIRADAARGAERRD